MAKKLSARHRAALESMEKKLLQGIDALACRDEINDVCRGTLCSKCPAIVEGTSDCFLTVYFEGNKLVEIQKVLGTYVTPEPLTNQEIADKFGVPVDQLQIVKED